MLYTWVKTHFVALTLKNTVLFMNGLGLKRAVGQVLLGSNNSCASAGVAVRLPWRKSVPLSPTLSPRSFSTLRLLNSLTREKDAVEMVRGESGAECLKWYTCGPTVYDACHLGHARAYVSLDVVRRVVEDYFKMPVLYHVNVTDVDDKILRKARQELAANRLTKGLKSGEFAAQDVIDEVNAACDQYEVLLQENVEAAETEGDLRDAQYIRDSFKDVRSAIVSSSKSGDAESMVREAAVPLGNRIGASSPLLADVAPDHETAKAVAQKYERMFFEDMNALGVRPFDVVSRVTENVDCIVSFISGIHSRGLAYESAGSVYLDTAAFSALGHTYRKLEPMPCCGGESGKGDDPGEKRHANDFVLWKAAREGEPFWESPWGPGRPGWHIECSAIASKVAGDRIDIHAGGIDLKFPHHDNELAQSEAYFGTHDWVRYFVHVGHLHIDGRKMSKSLKNFVTIREALESYSPKLLRLVFMLQPWAKPMTLSEESFAEASSHDQAFLRCLSTVESVAKGYSSTLESKYAYQGNVDWDDEEFGQRHYSDALLKTQTDVHAHLCNSVDTRRFISTLSEFARFTAAYAEQCHDHVQRCQSEGVEINASHLLLLEKGTRYILEMLSMTGLEYSIDDVFQFHLQGAAVCKSSASPLDADDSALIDAFVAFRSSVRAHQLKGESGEILGLCDELRDKTLPSFGVQVADGRGLPWTRCEKK